VNVTTTAAQMVADATALIDNVTPQQAAQEAAAGAVLLDVREPVEWEEYIVGALQVPRGVLEFQADPASPRHDVALDPARRVIVFCRSGARGALAGATLRSLGFTDVANMTGGLTSWKRAGLPTADHHDGL
jgi:rhodanese-related sulfurtransferase